jgi:hypothetical protein
LALKVTQLEAKNVQLEVKIGKLEAKDEQLKNLESTAIELRAKVTQLETKVEQQDSLLTSLLREKNERTAATATDFKSVPISNNPSAVAINGLPSSCGDLKMIGHTLNGFYSVMGLAKMESVYCDFTKLPDDAGKCFPFSRIIQLQLSNSIIDEKVFRNGLDTPTSNRRPSISTSREILHFTQNKLQFRSIWRW